jgi:hypothetical protein
LLLSRSLSGNSVFGEAAFLPLIGRGAGAFFLVGQAFLPVIGRGVGAFLPPDLTDSSLGKCACVRGARMPPLTHA